MIILNWLKWRIAARELSELERWKVEWETMRRWLAEFPDVATALDHLQAGAIGNGGQLSLFALREFMRVEMHTRISGYEPWQDKATADQVHIALIKNLRGQLTESVARIEDLERQLYAAKAEAAVAQHAVSETVPVVGYRIENKPGDYSFMNVKHWPYNAHMYKGSRVHEVLLGRCIQDPGVDADVAVVFPSLWKGFAQSSIPPAAPLTDADNRLASEMRDAHGLASLLRKERERFEFLHSTNCDADGWEWGVARVRINAGGRIEYLWGNSDHSDIDAILAAAEGGA